MENGLVTSTVRFQKKLNQIDTNHHIFSILLHNIFQTPGRNLVGFFEKV